MGSNFLEILKQVGIFMLAGQIIVHFRPSGHYEKYLKMILGIMVLSQLVVPVLSIFRKDVTENFENTMRSFGEKLEEAEDAAGQIEFPENGLGEAGVDGAVKEVLVSCANRQGTRVVNAYFTQEQKLRVVVRDADDTITVSPIRIGEEQETGPALEELEIEFAKALGMEAEKLEVVWGE